MLLAANALSKVAAGVLIASAAVAAIYTFVARTQGEASERSAEQYLARASRCAAEEDYAGAKEFYEKSLDIEPGSFEAYAGLFDVASAEGAEQEAAEYARLATDVVNENAKVWVTEGSGVFDDERYALFVDKLRASDDRELYEDACAAWLAASARGMDNLAAFARELIARGEWADAMVAALSFADLGTRRTSGDSEPGIDVCNMLIREIYAAVGATAPAVDGTEKLEIALAWRNSDANNPDAHAAAADCYVASGRFSDAESAYRDALKLNARHVASYDGLLGLLYRDSRLKDRFELLEAAVRNAGGQKYKDMLEATRVKLSDYYSTVVYDGAVYKDGITSVYWVDANGIRIEDDGVSATYLSGLSKRLEYYDETGVAKTMTLEGDTSDATIADVDKDGKREAVVRSRVADSARGISQDASRSVLWADIYEIDRSVNRLVYATPEHKAYYTDAFAPELAADVAQFERLRDAMEGHYGVAYGLLRAMRQAAIEFANGEWTPDITGDALRRRMSEILIVGDLSAYIKDKSSPYGEYADDYYAGGVGLGMAETEVRELLGAPRHVTEEQFEGIDKSGAKRPYLNKLLEYADINVYSSDGVVKAFRVNSRAISGPRYLRVGDTAYDIINKFPSEYFDGVANFAQVRRDSDTEIVAPDTGSVLSYATTDGLITGISVFANDEGGDYRPGLNIETILAGSGAPGGATDEADGSADEADGATDESDGTADEANGATATVETDGATADNESVSDDTAENAAAEAPPGERNTVESGAEGDADILSESGASIDETEAGALTDRTRDGASTDETRADSSIGTTGTDDTTDDTVDAAVGETTVAGEGEASAANASDGFLDPAAHIAGSSSVDPVDALEKIDPMDPIDQFEDFQTIDPTDFGGESGESGNSSSGENANGAVGSSGDLASEAVG